jgi:tetratricopeptide (TPR) repeat protein
VKPKNINIPWTTGSEKVSAEVPGVTVIEPLPLIYGPKAKRDRRNWWKGVLVIAILAVVVSAGGFLLNHLSKRPGPELVRTPDAVPSKPEVSERAQAAQGKVPPVAEKERKQEPTRPVSAKREIAAGTKAEDRSHGGPKSSVALKEKDPGDRRTLEEQFHRHLSNGLAAYHGKDLARAKSELTRAHGLKPDSGEVTEALTQVESEIRLQSIADLEAGAAKAEELEEWGKALDLYNAALKIDAALQFAAQGRERTLERMEIDKRLQFYIQKPEALESEEYLARATELLKRTEGIEPKGPRLKGQLEAFAGLIREAQGQTRVTLISDNLTEVSVYRVGRLGHFSAHELLLRPGRYMIVGTRDGYKDVRQEISVKPGGASLQVNIVCREKV